MLDRRRCSSCERKFQPMPPYPMISKSSWSRDAKYGWRAPIASINCYTICIAQPCGHNQAFIQLHSSIYHVTCSPCPLSSPTTTLMNYTNSNEQSAGALHASSSATLMAALNREDTTANPLHGLPATMKQNASSPFSDGSGVEEDVSNDPASIYGIPECPQCSS